MMQRFNGASKEEPAIGSWYDSKDFPECFKVVAYEGHDSVEIQYYDGEIEEIDYETWLTLHPHEVAAPENASSGYEMDHEDMLDLLDEISSQNDQTLDDHLLHIDQDESRWD